MSELPTKALSIRQWTAFSDSDGEPWALFVYGHGHDLAQFESAAAHDEMMTACRYTFCLDGDDARDLLCEPIIEFWIRDESDGDPDAECPYFFCAEADAGALAVTGMKFP